MKKQLIVISDMEGVSGIFDENSQELMNGSDQWRDYGKDKMTSDVLAVCEAANEFGIDEILYYDSHFAGNKEYNVHVDQLPTYVKLFDLPDRCFFWRRIRGQAAINPFGIITVGQHARNGETDAYFAHTIQSPPIKSFWVNNKHIAEIGMSVLHFPGTKYIANIGCEASKKEAKELTKNVHHITVKDKLRNWEPPVEVTYDIIKKGVLEALNNYNALDEIELEGPFKFKMELCKFFYFDSPKTYPWKGTFEKNIATWEAPSFEIGAEIFNHVRNCIDITDNDLQRVREEKANGIYSTMD